ncbi:unnamed protein product [Meloidogyne enterolobii]|uniref:Uncharacterized protein n=1 Tax=Meloidogyne enterolobii TaxID=390850 RepID=A0ACB1AGZ0_MELEN
MDWDKLYNDKDCKSRHTDKTTYTLGNITDGEILIQFTLWTGTNGKEATVEVLNGKESIIKLYANETMIIHSFEVNLCPETGRAQEHNAKLNNFLTRNPK